MNPRAVVVRTVACVVTTWCVLPMSGADWPRFHGPDGTGVSPETGLARAWPEGGPKVLWKLDLKIGYGGAAVRDGKAYFLERDTQKDYLRCVDLGTGKDLWSYSYEANGSLPYPGSLTMPTVEADRLYAMGPFGHLHCIDLATGKPVWSHNIVEEFKEPDAVRWAQTQVPKWGITQCPAIYRDMVIVAPQSRSVGLAAYDKATGKLRWTSPYVGRNWFSHVTPYVTALCGTDQVVMIANKHSSKDPPAVISSVDANSGRLLWQLETWKRYNMPIPAPVRIAEDKLFISGGYRIGCFVLKVARDGEKWTTDYAFKDNDNCTAHIHRPIPYKGHIYAQSFDGPHNTVNNGLVCLDFDGKCVWKTGPDVVFDNGPLLIADGMVFVMNGKTGELHLFEASPDGPKQLAKAKVLEADGGNAWAPMALSDGKLIVRDLRQMKCLDVRRP